MRCSFGLFCLPLAHLSTIASPIACTGYCIIIIWVEYWSTHLFFFSLDYGNFHVGALGQWLQKKCVVFISIGLTCLLRKLNNTWKLWIINRIRGLDLFLRLLTKEPMQIFFLTRYKEEIDPNLYSSSSHYNLHLDYNNVKDLPIYMPYEKVTIYDITPLQKKRKERGSQSGTELRRRLHRVHPNSFFGKYIN